MKQAYFGVCVRVRGTDIKVAPVLAVCQSPAKALATAREVGEKICPTCEGWSEGEATGMQLVPPNIILEAAGALKLAAAIGMN